MLKILQTDKEYENNLKQYTKRDGILSSDLTIKNFSWIIDLFITHLVLNFIYLKTNSLYGAIIPHWMSNFAYNIILK